MIAQHIKLNLKSGITVALISIPLSVSLAVASNASPALGILTAFWAGLIAALFGGSHYNIVGPTGALSGVIAMYVIAHGISALPVLTIATGIIIIISYFLKLERYLTLVPSSVIHGFTLGVAFIIALNQLNAAFGLSGLTMHERFIDNVIESLRHLPNLSWPAVGIFLVFLVGLLLFKKLTPKLPGAIILTPVGIILGYAGSNNLLPFQLQTLADKFSTISFSAFQPYQLVWFPELMSTALVVALIAILETMLSARIADGMTHTKHHERKEMLGLGLANIVTGLFGGMPATAALARTSLNIKTGGTHKTSAAISSIAVALISVFLLSYFKFIPMAVIAAILVFVAINMIEAEHFKKLFHYDKSGFLVALLVAAVTIGEDPMVGILVGVSISLLIFVNRLSRGPFDLTTNKFQEGVINSIAGEKIKEIKEDADVLLYSFKGKLCYINGKAHLSRFETDLTKYKWIILRLREVYFMDIDGVETLDEIIAMILARQQQVILTSIDPTVISLLEQASKEYPKLKAQGLVFRKTQIALEHLGIKPRSN